MKIAFHVNHLDMRGTGVAVFDYANHAERLLGHESLIVCPSVKAQPHFQDERAARRFEQRFPVYRYDRFDISRWGSDLLTVADWSRRVNGDLLALPLDNRAPKAP
ncbi:MAG TPA: hypothetical protein VMH26_16265 [Burkholderiales bacterium]|nr:hypothetical protein [Burkholderiales bacterium]